MSNSFEELKKQKEEQLAEITTVYKSGSMFRSMNMISKGATDAVPLWGDYIFKQALSLIIGDPGIGKTTFTYSLMLEIIKNGHFLNIPAADELKFLTMDFESSDPLIKSRQNRYIERDPDLLQYFDKIKIYNAEYPFDVVTPFLKHYHDTEYKFDIIVVDNLMTAFGMQDENDNAEAIKRIKYLRNFAKEIDCAILMLHHPSKANAEGLRKGSGAFAWARSADVYLNFNDKGAGIVEAEIAKNRWAENKDPIYFSKNGKGEFVRCEVPSPIELERDESRPIAMITAIILGYKGRHKRSDIIDYVKGRTEGKFSNALVDKALRKLVIEKLIGWVYGFYEIK